MMKCGLLGRKLGHSYSPQIHAHLGTYSYDLFEKEPDEVEDFLRNGDFAAINVTIPYKKTVMPYCRLTERAKYMGSVNTIIRQPDGTLLGHNTDYFGFSSMVKRSGLDVAGKKCLVLGSGGASVTAVAVLKEMNGEQNNKEVEQKFQSIINFIYESPTLKGASSEFVTSPYINDLIRTYTFNQEEFDFEVQEEQPIRRRRR